MNQAKRLAKRIILFLVFLAFLILLFLVGYLFLKPEPTCSDGIQNQGEKGVDCGGPCAPCALVIETKEIEVLGAEFVSSTEGNFDVVVKVKNPNDLIGAKNFTLKVIFLDENGLVLGEIEKKDGFALPKEEKQVLIYGAKTLGMPFSVQAKIENVSWEKFSQYETPRFVIINKNYQKLSGGSAWFSQARGTLVNRSGIDFETVSVNVILRDESGKLLAINHQIINTITSGEQRDFVASFPVSFEGEVASFETQVETNVFDSENYIRVYGGE